MSAPPELAPQARKQGLRTPSPSVRMLISERKMASLDSRLTEMERLLLSTSPGHPIREDIDALWKALSSMDARIDAMESKSGL